MKQDDDMMMGMGMGMINNKNDLNNLYFDVLVS